MWAVIADWDDNNRVTRYNYVKTKSEATRLIDRLNGVEPTPKRQEEMQALVNNRNTSVGKRAWAEKEKLPLPLEKQTGKAYCCLVDLVSPEPACDDFMGEATVWECDPVAKTVVFNVERLTDKIRSRRKACAKNEIKGREVSGVMLNGVKLATDTDGIAKLHHTMVTAQRAEAAEKSVNLRNRTKNGEKIAVTSAVQAEEMFEVCCNHVETVQEACDVLCDTIDAMTLADLKEFDVGTWTGWPSNPGA